MTIRTIAVWHPGGGVGKTTTTFNLAWAIAALRPDLRIAAVDLDNRADLSRRLAAVPALPTLATQMLTGHGSAVPLEFTWQQPYGGAGAGFDLFAADPHQMGGLDLSLGPLTERERRLRRSLARLPYDLILLDCPPNLTLTNVNAAYAADGLLVPVQAQDKAVEQLPDLLRAITEIQTFREDTEGRPLPLILGYLLTMVERTLVGTAAEQDVRNAYGAAVLTATIPKSTALQVDGRYRAPIGVYEPTNKAAVAYRLAAQEVLDRALT